MTQKELDLLSEIKTLCPELRLGQIICVVTRCQDPFYTDDDLMERGLERMVERLKKGGVQ